jgi:hypothetical protein
MSCVNNGESSKSQDGAASRVMHHQSTFKFAKHTSVAVVAAMQRDLLNTHTPCTPPPSRWRTLMLVMLLFKALVFPKLPSTHPMQ